MPTTRPAEKAARRVLVIDDDQGVLDLIATVLERQGYDVETARTSHAALAMVRRSEFDLVLLDLILPDADGVILHGKLRKISPGIEQRIIFMTGFTSEEPVIDYLRSLSADFLHKPFGPEELVRAVSRIG